MCKSDGKCDECALGSIYIDGNDQKADACPLKCTTIGAVPESCKCGVNDDC